MAEFEPKPLGIRCAFPYFFKNKFCKVETLPKRLSDLTWFKFKVVCSFVFLWDEWGALHIFCLDTLFVVYGVVNDLQQHLIFFLWPVLFRSRSFCVLIFTVSSSQSNCLSTFLTKSCGKAGGRRSRVWCSWRRGWCGTFRLSRRVDEHHQFDQAQRTLAALISLLMFWGWTFVSTAWPCAHATGLNKAWMDSSPIPGWTIQVFQFFGWCLAA